LRFIPNGPSIPDDLLNARDAGQVLFFCGAGVSRAKANLPDFKTLSGQVLGLLGSAADSPARKLFDAAITSEELSGVSGLVPYDRIFGMLEREFLATEVRSAVAEALRPKSDYCLDAHRTLLDLSRTRIGTPRLVTTNFDLLFEECEPGIASYNPPKLPDPSRTNEFGGIIHLHGRVDEKYQRAYDDEFVLSSADFGHAYLSNGWATRYIQSLLDHFRIVFVGYSADDPPVQYLLEALNRFGRPSRGLYAFQPGDYGQAAQQWAHKGVEPIPYENVNVHSALWDTLSAWAYRARDVDGWHKQLIARAHSGPAAMAPHERGMIAYLASSVTGAQSIANAKLPADWLYVLDRNERFRRPNRFASGEAIEVFEPFDVYGLDSDPLPPSVDPDNLHARRLVPESAWDAFEVTRSDMHTSPLATVARIRNAAALSELPKRLANLGWWLCSVAHEPAALWWAAEQAPLHPHITQSIERSLVQDNRFTPLMRSGWRALLRSWQYPANDTDIDKYAIEREAQIDGWSPPLIRRAMSLYRPRLSVSRSFANQAPAFHPDLVLTEILSIQIEYPRPHEPIDISDDWLTYAVSLFRQHIEEAVQLERERQTLDYIYLDSIVTETGEAPDEHHHGLTGQVACFVNMVARLSRVDVAAARDEIVHWNSSDPVFTRLRLWACHRSDIINPEEAGKILTALDDRAFWIHGQERDLLLTLRDRWFELPSSAIRHIEEKLRYGEIPFGLDHEDREKLVAHHRLDRIQWLSDHNVKFGFDKVAVIASLREFAPDWTEGNAKHAAQPMVSGVQWIATDLDARPLEHLPIPDILRKSQELSTPRFDEGVERRPFHGLAVNRPTRALRAVTYAARNGEFVIWAWNALLYADNPSPLPIRLLSVMGYRLARLASSQLAQIMYAASEWLRKHGNRLMSEQPAVFAVVWNALLGALNSSPASDSALRKGPKRWVEESLNSTVGHMLDTWLNDPAHKDLLSEQGLPIDKRERLEQVLALPAEHRRHAVVLVASRLHWLFRVDPVWTTNHLVPIGLNPDDDSQAFWAGYLWMGRAPHPKLFALVKTKLVSLIREETLRQDEAKRLAGILLATWGHSNHDTPAESAMSDLELREILIHSSDEFRTSMLWYLQNWARDSESPFPERLLTFFNSVWPRQRALRTALISEKLVFLALSIPERFAEIVPAILQRLVPLRAHSIHFTGVVQKEILDTCPECLVELLSVTLTDDATQWPYGTHDLLIQLAELPTTQNDPRLAKLRRDQQRQLY
jgi:hypothetical protein